MPRYRVTKTYGHDLGLSACFRQWRATSHCAQLHGYALAFELVFEADTLDERNWVLDFGSLTTIKAYLQSMFDHTLLVASDDPIVKTQVYDALSTVADMRFVADVGCEAFARLVYDYVSNWLGGALLVSLDKRDVRLVQVTCREHGANAATYIGD